jgi:hypothetical protein
MCNMKGPTFGPISATRNGTRFHEPRDEMRVTPEAAELRHRNRRFETAGMGQRRGELGPAVERSA